MTGDYFVMTDILGLDTAATLALATPAGWSTSVMATTANYLPPGVPASDTAVPNVVWTRTGANITTAGGLGIFSLVSTLHHITLTLYSGNDHDQSGPPGPLPRSNYGVVEAPSPTGPDAVPLPLTASAGMLLLGLVRQRRTRRQ